MFSSPVLLEFRKAPTKSGSCQRPHRDRFVQDRVYVLTVVIRIGGVKVKLEHVHDPGTKPPNRYDSELRPQVSEFSAVIDFGLL